MIDFMGFNRRKLEDQRREAADKTSFIPRAVPVFQARFFRTEGTPKGLVWHPMEANNE